MNFSCVFPLLGEIPLRLSKQYYTRVVVQIAICLHSAVQKGFFIISPAYGYKMRALREISSLNALRNIAHGMSKF